MAKYDIAIIGGGPGGYTAAIRAAQLGAKVCLVEKERLGGTCLNKGCIPTKALVAVANKMRQMREAASFGIDIGNCRLDYSRAADHKDQVVSQLVTGLEMLFKKNKIELIEGAGELLGGKRIRVVDSPGNERIIEAENIIIATGSEPAIIKNLGYNGDTVVTSTEALRWRKLPSSLLIVGGGVVGCEFAGIFSALGVKVTMVEALPAILPSIDAELSRRQRANFKQQGVEVKTGITVKSVAAGSDNVVVSLSNGEEVAVEKVIISIGRTMNTGRLGLEAAGISLGQRGEVAVDDCFRTSAAGIYAVGDVTGKFQLAHAARAQGLAAVAHITGCGDTGSLDVVPYSIFTYPEIAGVGMTAQEAEASGVKLKIGRFLFSANGKALCMREGHGIVKVIADAESDRVLGVHILGPEASDLIAEAALAINMKATLKQLINTIHAHPTLAETLLEAAEAAKGMAIHS